MSKLIIFTSCIILPLLAFSQKEVQLLEKEVNGLIIISAVNTSKKDFQATVNIESSGFTLSKPLPIIIVLKAGATEELITMTPQPGQAWDYHTRLSYTPVTTPSEQTVTPGKEGEITKSLPSSQRTTQTATPEQQVSSTDEGIILYTKAGCGRCTQAKEYLRSIDVSFKEVDLSSKSSEVDAMWRQLREQGFTGSRVQTPIVSSKGRLYHEIPDIKKFLGEIVSGGKE